MNREGALPVLTVSADGYVRLSAVTFLSVPLRHYFSELDPSQQDLSSLVVGASAVSISGLTEWVSETSPVLSLAWDWYLDVSPGPPHYRRSSNIRTNVMLIDDVATDLGSQLTETLLGATIETLGWQDTTAQFINKLYACHLSVLTGAS